MTKQEPEKLKGTSLDIAEDNRLKLKQLFPTVFTETVNEKGELVESIDFEKLKAELGTFTDLFESRREPYGLQWSGKKEALKLIQTHSNATLKPCKEESVNFDSTENLFIEGDNLEVLKLLQKSYYGKVKMIYIDPPYNKNGDFIYPDNYSESLSTYLEYAGLVDGEGRKFTTNTTNEGRFHTKWLNMMYPRLYLARNLLRDDGVIFISIDESEISNLRKICDEIFGEENFVADIAVKMSESTGVKMAHADKKLPKLKESILFYKKNTIKITPVLIPKDRWDNEYKTILDIKNKEVIKRLKEIRDNENRTDGDNVAEADLILSTITTKSLSEYYKELSINDEKKKMEFNYNNAWRIIQTVSMSGGAKTLADKKRKENDSSFFSVITPEKKMYFIRNHYSETIDIPRIKVLFADDYLSINPGDFWQDIKTTGLDNEGDVDFKNGKKPLKIIDRMLNLTTLKEDIILDFFSGSATTAHAVLDLNKQDNGNRKFIMVQLPEPCQPDSEAFKAKYKTIADIGKARIRRVIEKLNQENDGNLDFGDAHVQDRGFKVLKLDKSNFKEWQQLDPSASVEEIERELFNHIDHIDPKSTPEDLLYEILLKAGFTLTEKIETVTIADTKVFSVADGGLLLCLEKSVTKELIDAVAEAEPMHFICLDSAFHGNDQLKANAVQTFAARNMQREKHNQIKFETV